MKTEILDKSKYKDGIELIGDIDGHKVSNYQIVSEHIAKRIADIIGKTKILELCSGIGATTFVLAQTFLMVYAVDIDPDRINYAKENIKKLDLSNVEFLTGDAFSIDILNKLSKITLDAVYTDVEWTVSGIYGQDHAVNLYDTNPNTVELFNYINQHFSSNICMRLPKNIDRKQLRELGSCEIEEVYKDGTIKFINVYFGKLISKADSRFEFSV